MSSKLLTALNSVATFPPNSHPAGRQGKAVGRQQQRRLLVAAGNSWPACPPACPPARAPRPACPHSPWLLPTHSPMPRSYRACPAPTCAARGHRPAVYILWIRPHQVAEGALVWDLAHPVNHPHLVQRAHVWRQPAVHAKHAAVNHRLGGGRGVGGRRAAGSVQAGSCTHTHVCQRNSSSSTSRLGNLRCCLTAHRAAPAPASPLPCPCSSQNG
jgi:hypothetical protein